MELLIKQIVNEPVSSNCYVLYKKGSPKSIVIDPGSRSGLELKEFLSSNQLLPEYIILTHHHFDHVWGVNDLVSRFGAKILCSRACADKITDKKLNLSLFYDDEGFILPQADLLIEDLDFHLDWCSERLVFYDTTGHSEGCISILVNFHLFTGDALIKGNKPVTKLPGGNKLKLKETYNFYRELLSDRTDLITYPGHGEIFKLNNKDLELN